MADELEKQGSQESRAYAKIIKGEINHQRHDIVKAVQSFQGSQTVMDLWLAQYDLGVAYVENGDYPAVTLRACASVGHCRYVSYRPLPENDAVRASRE